MCIVLQQPFDAPPSAKQTISIFQLLRRRHRLCRDHLPTEDLFLGHNRCFIVGEKKYHRSWRICETKGLRNFGCVVVMWERFESFRFQRNRILWLLAANVMDQTRKKQLKTMKILFITYIFSMRWMIWNVEYGHRKFFPFCIGYIFV